VDDLEGTPFPAPAGRGLLLDLAAGEAGEGVQDGLGEAGGGLGGGGVVGGGRGGGGGGAPRAGAGGGGGGAGGGGGEQRGEEERDGDQGGEEAVAEGDALVAQGLANLVGGEEVGEGEPGGAGELLLQPAGLAVTAGGGSMSHGWPPCGRRSVATLSLARQA